jgi:hypothetical protein
MQETPNDKNRSDLEKIMAVADQAAEMTLRECGDVLPTFTGLTSSGSFLVPSDDFRSDEAKEAFTFLIRLVCIATGATAGVLAMESWVVLPKPGQQVDLSVRASLSLHRREALFLTGQALGGIHCHRARPILRDAKGHFIGLGPAEEFARRPLLGRFSRLLPDSAPNDAEREAAAKALATIGVRIPPCQRGGPG